MLVCDESMREKAGGIYHLLLFLPHSIFVCYHIPLFDIFRRFVTRKEGLAMKKLV